MFRLAITMCPFTFKVTEFPLVSAYKQSQTPLQPASTKELECSGHGCGLTWKTLQGVLVTSPTLYDPMDCSRSGSSVHEILQARILEGVAMPSLGIFPTQVLNPSLLHCRQILYHLSLNYIH